MNLTLDVGKRKVTGDGESLSESIVASLKLSRRARLRLTLVRDGAAMELGAGDEVLLVLKPEGQFEVDPLQMVTLTASDLTLGKYDKTFSIQTEPVRALLGLDGNSANDVGHKRISAALVYVPSGGEPEEADEFFITLRNAVLQDEDGEVDDIDGPDAALTARAVRHDIAQTISTDGKDRARTNIGAASSAALTAIEASVDDLQDDVAALETGISNVEADLSSKADLVGGKVPSGQLPSYVDDVVEAANFAALPVTGETGKIYVTVNDNKSFRWSGSAYVEMTSSPSFASQAEAEAGTNNTNVMTPLRVRQAIAKLGGTMTAYLGGPGASSSGVLNDPLKPWDYIQNLIFDAQVVAWLAAGGGNNQLIIEVRPTGSMLGSLVFYGHQTNHATALAAMTRVIFVGVDPALCAITSVQVTPPAIGVSPLTLRLRGNGKVRIGTNTGDSALLLQPDQTALQGQAPDSWAPVTVTGSVDGYLDGTYTFENYDGNGLPRYHCGSLVGPSSDGYITADAADGDSWTINNGMGSLCARSGGNYLGPAAATGWSDGQDGLTTSGGGSPTGQVAPQAGRSGNYAYVSGFHIRGVISAFGRPGGAPGLYSNASHPGWPGQSWGAGGDGGFVSLTECDVFSDYIELQVTEAYDATFNTGSVGAAAGNLILDRCRGVIGVVQLQGQNSLGQSPTVGTLYTANSAVSIGTVNQINGGGSPEVKASISGVNGVLGLQYDPGVNPSILSWWEGPHPVAYGTAAPFASCLVGNVDAGVSFGQFYRTP